MWPGPINTVYTDQDLLASAVSLARSHGTGWHTHLSAPKSDPDVYRETYGLRPGMWLHREGLLGPDAVLAHATWVNDEEIEAIGSTRTAVVHCPMSNQYVPYGVMPMRRLLDAGATVALGTDGSTCGHRQDLFENMKMLVLMHRLAELDPGASSAAEALRIATTGGAAALGIDAGRLVPGALADVIVLDTSSAHLHSCTRSPHRPGIRGPGKRRDHEHRRREGRRRGGTVHAGRSGRGDLRGSRPRARTHKPGRACLEPRDKTPVPLRFHARTFPLTQGRLGLVRSPPGLWPEPGGSITS